jgi:glycosyltransferase involved in cell wall biosynthesis
MPKHILIVTQAGSAWPSGWTRALIYRELFRINGIEADYLSFQSPRLVEMLMGRQGPKFARALEFGLGFILRRLNLLYSKYQGKYIIRRASQGYDAIYLQKTGSLEMVSALRKVYAGRLIYDLNDAVWLPANASHYANGKIPDLLRAVDAVTCDNPNGLSFASAFNKNVYLVPDPSQVELFDQQRHIKPNSKGQLVLGWIGGPTTLFNLYSIWEALEIVFSTHTGITLRLVGTGYNQALLPRFEKVNYTCLPYYSQGDMVREVLAMDIGLFPLFDVDDSLARGILKATIYMSGESAVVASPRGQVPELIRDGINGMLANSTSEWVEKLELLIADQQLRQRITLAGLKIVRREYSTENCFRSLLSALDKK